ncbi:S1C family serine protease [Paludisphaera rhizosphaerae]|uniref:S1C family serine protease n=1 Tax=Paludisphaera rhizosphaerae TaxID=2711216 RepID=UPI0013EA2373|nr:S1C family serine protease [Paludisphaera rhizosphaerae]
MVRRLYSLLAFPLFLLGGVALAGPPEESVVRVFATLRLPNPIRPWARQNAIETSGTGVVLDDHTILTNAHVVSYATRVSVQSAKGGDRFEAKVVTSGPDIDLATLLLEDETFFKSAPAMPRAAVRPAPNAAVAVYGFPVGGTGMAVTRGVVSRIDFGDYPSGEFGMRIQIDAAVNPGSSGGPALVDDKMIGLTFGQLGMAENVGYVVPNEEIDSYLADMKDGRYDGKPGIFDRFQTIENEALRAKLGLDRSVRGVMVRKPWRTTDDYPLREFDVITQVGGSAIDNEGFADVDGIRLPFDAVVPRLAAAGPVAAKLIRNGKTIDGVLPVSSEDVGLLKSYRGRQPSFFVHGPLVFSPVYADAVPIYAKANPLAMLGSPIISRRGDFVAFPGEELVIVTAPMMQHKLTRGYDEHFGQIIRDVDGHPVRNLLHLVELLRDAQGEYVTLRFDGDLIAETMVFPRKALDDSTAELMEDNGIPRRGSEDAIAVWERKAPAAK